MPFAFRSPLTAHRNRRRYPEELHELYVKMMNELKAFKVPDTVRVVEPPVALALALAFALLSSFLRPLLITPATRPRCHPSCRRRLLWHPSCRRRLLRHPSCRRHLPLVDGGDGLERCAGRRLGG